MSAQSLTYVEIDIDRCSRTYGVAPCTASIPTTGSRKCFNSLGTCQDRSNFNDTGVTLRFAVDASYLPADIECIPCIRSVDYSPATLSLGGDLGQRASLKISLKDHRDSDTGPNGDPYLSDRSYNPFTQGTFFGKFRARHPYLRGRSLRLIRGAVGDALADMETRHFVIDSIDGPLPDGSFAVIAKDPLKLADAERAQAPVASNGYTSAEVLDVDASLTLLPVGVGTEYETSGYVAIGGAEIVAFTRDPYAGLNANTALYFKFDGADGSTTITDSSGNGRNGSVNGNAQLDTANKKFGASSLYLDGTGDYITVADNAAWTPAGDCTIDAWVYPETVSVQKFIASQVQTANTLEWRITINSNGSLNFTIYSGGVAVVSLSSAASLMIVNQWQHIAVTRSGNNWKLFRNGVIVASVTDSDGFPANTGSLVVGGGGVGGGTSTFQGWIDNFRFQSGEASWTADFSALLPVPYNSSSDILTLTDRGQFNTEATTHEANSRVQTVLRYSGEDVANIIADLFETYAGFNASWLPTDEWLQETQAHLQRLYTATIAEPTSVKKLVDELIEQAALAVWWDEREQKVRLQVLRAISTSVQLFDEDNTMEGSIQVKDQPDKRISEVWTYFGQINPLKRDDPDNFRSIAITRDDQSTADYGSSAIKKVFSRWIQSGGRTAAERLNDILIARFKVPPRRVNLDDFRDGIDDPTMGQGARVAAWFVQDDTGAAAELPIQITRVGPEADRFKIEAEEMLFDLAEGDLGDRTIIIDANENNINWRTRYDELYPTPESGDVINCIINSGVIVGSTSAATPSFQVGSWPGGVTLNLVVNGRLQGKGGNGGEGSPYFSVSPGAGTAGGDALYTRTAINLSGSGEIFGGGGGGGGGNFIGQRGGGGGGGRGQTPGRGNDYSGTDGTTEAPGSGGLPSSGSGFGGSGGNVAEAGQSGSGASGGAAGKAIDGNSYITESGTLTVTGSRVN